MTVLCITILILWLIYEWFAQTVAEIQANHMRELEKKLRDSTKKPDDK